MGREGDQPAVTGGSGTVSTTTSEWSGTSGGGPVSRGPAGLGLGLCLTVVAVAFESIAVATAMPVAARDLDGLSHYAWSFSAFGVGMLFSTVAAGRACDRVGPAAPLRAGLLVFILGLLVAATAEQMAQLVAGRLVQGLGSGVIGTAVVVCVARAYREDERPRMFTAISTAWVLPAFAGPPVAALVTESWGWPWVFVSVVPLVLLGGALVLPRVRGLTQERRNPDDPAGGARPAPLWAAALVALGTVALQVAGQRLDAFALVLLVVGAAALVLGLPSLMPGCFTRFGRGLPAVIITRGLLAGAFVGGEAFLPLMLVEEKGLALVWAGAALTAGSVGWLAGSWLQARPWLRLRRDRIITLGCSAVVCGLASVALNALTASLPGGYVALGWVVAGFGMGLATSSTALAVMSLSRVAEQGRNASSLNLSDALGSALLVAGAGTVFAALSRGGNLPTAFGTLLLAVTAVSLLAVLASLRIGALSPPGAAVSDETPPAFVRSTESSGGTA
ncbi:MFS transporter [Microlunatus lacustris]